MYTVLENIRFTEINLDSLGNTQHDRVQCRFSKIYIDNLGTILQELQVQSVCKTFRIGQGHPWLKITIFILFVKLRKPSHYDPSSLVLWELPQVMSATGDHTTHATY